MTGPLVWSDPEPDGLERGVLQVPLDHDRPGGPSVEVAIGRLRAADPTRRRGVLVTMNGGPGGNAGLGAQLPRHLRDTRLAEVYDIIGIDLRGYGRSTPTVRARLDPPRSPFDSRPPDSAFALIAEDMRARLAACERDGGPVRPTLCTETFARDLDVLRQALQESQLNLLGFAYGTLVTAMYGELYPRHLDRSVLDSSTHPEWDWHAQFAAQAQMIECNVRAWAQWVAALPAPPLGRDVDEVLATLDRVAARLADLPGGRALRTTYDGQVGGLAPDRRAWAQLVHLIEQVDQAAAAARPDLAWQVLGQAGGRQWTPDGSDGAAVLEAVTVETPWTTDLPTYFAAMRRTRDTCPYGYAVVRVQPWVGTYAAAPARPRPVIGPRQYPRGLVIRADHDPNNHPDGSHAMANLLDHRLITIRDCGDNSLFSFCGHGRLDTIVEDYLTAGRLPDQDISLPGHHRPPTSSATARAGLERPAARSETSSGPSGSDGRPDNNHIRRKHARRDHR